MKTIHSNIWYADESRAKSPKKLLVYSDRGDLKYTENGIEFNGENTELNIDNISHISLKNQQLNWVNYLVGGLACILLDLILGSGISDLTNTDWPLTKLFIFLAPICILLFWLPVRWVVVSYRSDGAHRKAYFSSGNASGFAALFGANKKIKKELMDAATSIQIAPS
ncbi:MAG: hypothetical protein ABR574_01015 [Cryomorphaceae bacterium]|nr:hypothetical protein [Flavobacteriales bacterium]